MSKLKNADMRRMVLARFKDQPEMQAGTVQRQVDTFYQGTLSVDDVLTLTQVLYDLVGERILTFGISRDPMNAKWPFFRLTEHGKKVLTEGSPHYFDPEDYLHHVVTLTPVVDDVITKYAQEAIRSYRAQLSFGAAVMLGAATERAILLLLEAIKDWESDPSRKDEAANLLERQRSLPKIFKFIRSTMNRVANGKNKPMPYAIHQGCTEHLLSFFEMVRVQRNDAVHPKAADVDRTKVFLALQTFPEALRVIERVRQWFVQNVGT